MQTTLTISTPEAPAGKITGPNRYPPQPETTLSARRFAELLQRRRDAQPPAQAPEAAPQPRLNAEPRAKPIACAPENDDAHGNAGGKRTAGDEDKPADGAASEASTGSAASRSQATSTAPARPTGEPRDLPTAEVPILPPTVANDTPTLTASSAASGGADAVADGANRPAAMPRADLLFWPGMPTATADATTTAIDAIGAGGRGTLDLRIGTGAGAAAPGAPGNLSAGLTLAGSAGQHGAGGQGAGDQSGDAAADHAAALLAKAASSAEVATTASATGDRFALPLRAAAPEGALPGWAGGITAHRAEGSASTPIMLPVPPTAPDFAKALGAQISLFARNGLAQAELQLTPAEMGPIRVQIAIDGAHARVDFAADSAATRQAIERGLPELASALREQGLTLSGGGVFQRAPDQNDEPTEGRPAPGRARRRAMSTSIDAVEPPSRSRPSSAQPGGVDLYA